MKNKLQIGFIILALLFGLSSMTFAQKGKGQTTKGQTTVKRDQDKTRDMDQDRDRDKDQDRDRDKDRDQDRDRLFASDQQRDQLRVNLETADKVRLQTRDMIRDCDNVNFSMNQAQQQNLRMREQLRFMDQEHNRLMTGLNDFQKARFQEDSKNMQQHREQIANRIQLMEQEMNQGQFDRIRQRTRLREIEKAVKEWREHYRHMQKHMIGS